MEYVIRKVAGRQEYEWFLTHRELRMLAKEGRPAAMIKGKAEREGQPM